VLQFLRCPLPFVHCSWFYFTRFERTFIYDVPITPYLTPVTVNPLPVWHCSPVCWFDCIWFPGYCQPLAFPVWFTVGWDAVGPCPLLVAGLPPRLPVYPTHLYTVTLRTPYARWRYRVAPFTLVYVPVPVLFPGSPLHPVYGFCRLTTLVSYLGSGCPVVPHGYGSIYRCTLGLTFTPHCPLLPLVADDHCDPSLLVFHYRTYTYLTPLVAVLGRPGWFLPQLTHCGPLRITLVVLVHLPVRLTLLVPSYGHPLPYPSIVYC